MLNLAIQNFRDQEFYSAELGRATLQLANLYHLMGEEDLFKENLRQATVLFDGISPGEMPRTSELGVDDFTRLICYNFR